MTNWYCKDCPVVGSDCGPWDDQWDGFKNVKLFHRNHPGFQIGEPKKLTEIEQAFTDYFNQHVDQWLQEIITSAKKTGKSSTLKNKSKQENSV